MVLVKHGQLTKGKVLLTEKGFIKVRFNLNVIIYKLQNFIWCVLEFFRIYTKFCYQ